MTVKTKKIENEFLAEINTLRKETGRTLRWVIKKYGMPPTYFYTILRANAFTEAQKNKIRSIFKGNE